MLFSSVVFKEQSLIRENKDIKGIIMQVGQQLQPSPQDQKDPNLSANPSKEHKIASTKPIKTNDLLGAINAGRAKQYNAAQLRAKRDISVVSSQNEGRMRNVFTSSHQ